MSDDDQKPPRILYQSAKFETSAAAAKQFPEPTGPEVGFSGRSNSGKSSTLNRLCQQRQLARVSKTPGRTQLINFFELPTGARLVDLPGYGFAKVPERERRRWSELIEAYLVNREPLQGLIMVMDIRRPLGEKDWQMLEWCSHHGISGHVVLNKSDKLKSGKIAQTKLKTDALLKKHFDSVSLQTFSAFKGTGIDELHTKLDKWLLK
ncbi:MAG TPA: YihA family ribosome biogenesis GTP-binding protein [Gammaproteobacteria bacterium]|nr:YihA family ribosome biogenesis GTP-binding protein [Gammaproteobacteria bacterium]